MAGSERSAREPRLFATAIVRHRRWIAVAWFALAAVLLPASRGVERVLDVSARIPGSESAAVEARLRDGFGSAFARPVILVVTGVPSPDHAAGEAALRLLVERLTTLSAVDRTFSWLDARDSVFLPRTGGTLLIVGLDPGDGRLDDILPALRAATARIERELRRSHPEAALRWTGELALNFDLRHTSAEDARTAERRVLPLTLLLLVLAFGAVCAALLPVASGILAIGISLGIAALLARLWPVSILLQNVVTMLGLGLGIDYALLMVSRFREARARGASPDDAAVEAARFGGRTVALSGIAVAIGFAALVLLPLGELRAVGLGGLIVVLVSVLLAFTLLPGVLASLGPRVDALRVPWARAGRSKGRRRWRRWGALVTRHPWKILAASGIPLLALAAQAGRIELELPRMEMLPPSMESSRALHELELMSRGGLVQMIQIVLEMPPGVSVMDSAGWSATAALSRRFEHDPRIARVRSLPTLAGSRGPSPPFLAALPEHVRRTLVTDDGSAALVELVPAERLTPGEMNALVREIRTAGAGSLSGLAGARLLAGGLPAVNVDYHDAVIGRMALLVSLVIGGTFVVLALAFRSVLVPVKALILNLLSVVGAFGLVVVVFQDGVGAGLLGLPGGVNGFFPIVPPLVFCVVFGLSMDYEIFLVARLREARRAGLPERAAVVEALARTGGVITSAAAIMVVVFAAFVLGDFVLIKMLGFELAAAVLLDATLVRLAVGPALLHLAGRWNWWPCDGQAAPEGVSVLAPLVGDADRLARQE